MQSEYCLFIRLTVKSFQYFDLLTDYNRQMHQRRYTKN